LLPLAEFWEASKEVTEKGIIHEHIVEWIGDDLTLLDDIYPNDCGRTSRRNFCNDVSSTGTNRCVGSLRPRSLR
jgi:hypothetical protein